MRYRDHAPPQRIFLAVTAGGFTILVALVARNNNHGAFPILFPQRLQQAGRPLDIHPQRIQGCPVRTTHQCLRRQVKHDIRPAPLHGILYCVTAQKIAVAVGNHTAQTSADKKALSRLSQKSQSMDTGAQFAQPQGQPSP